MWDIGQSWQCVALRDVGIEVRLGVYAKEHDAPQRIAVDVELYRHTGPGRPASLDECLNYDRIFGHLVETWPARPHTPLLEHLAEDLVEFVMEDLRVEACRVILRKLDIYGGRAVPSIEVYRLRTPL